MNVPDDLREGDVLFYSPSSLLGWGIAIKTWTAISHVEGYCGRRRVIAARREGVGIYTERIDKYLVCVRRPMVEHFNMAGAWKAIMPLMGEYDLMGAVSFFLPNKHDVMASRMCSPVITTWLRGGGCEPFNPSVEAADVAPAQLWQTPALNTVWNID